MDIDFCWRHRKIYALIYPKKIVSQQQFTSKYVEEGFLFEEAKSLLIEKQNLTEVSLIRVHTISIHHQLNAWNTVM